MKLMRFAGKLILWFFLVTIAWTALLRFVPVYFTPLMIIRSAEAIRDKQPIKNSKKWVSIEQISPHMIQAVVAAEDNLFMEHKGFSFEDIRKAWEHNQKGKRIRGGRILRC